MIQTKQLQPIREELQWIRLRKEEENSKKQKLQQQTGQQRQVLVSLSVKDLI